MTKDKFADDEEILINNEEIRIDDEKIGTEYLFNKTWTWQIIKSVTEGKFVTIYLTKFLQIKLYFPRKKRKTIFGDQVLFVGKEASGDENEYTLFF